MTHNNELSIGNIFFSTISPILLTALDLKERDLQLEASSQHLVLIISTFLVNLFSRSSSISALREFDVEQ